MDLRFPSMLRLANAYQDIANEARNLDDSVVPPTGTGNLDDLNDNGDLLVLLDEQIEVFLNSIAPDKESAAFLGALGYSRQRDDYEINIRDILDKVSLNGRPELNQVQGKQADQIIELNLQPGNGDIIPAALNADGRDDVFVFTAFDGSHIEGILLLSN